VLFGGDFNQLAAVGDKSLYRCIDPLETRYHQVVGNETAELGKETEQSKLDDLSETRNEKANVGPKRSKVKDEQTDGLRLWDTITKNTIILKHHYRAENDDISQSLDRFRVGKPSPSDLEKLKSRVFGHRLNSPNPKDPRWQNALFVTPRNIVRQAWNHQAALRHITSTGFQMFISPAKDDKNAIKDKDMMIWTIDSDTEMLATWNILCIEGPAIITTNIAVELGFANGTRVTIKQVVPHPGDEKAWLAIDREQIIMLSQPPICVWVVPTNTENFFNPFKDHFNGDESRGNWFPILPVKSQVDLKSSSKILSRTKFYRTQIPLTPGFAASDHRVQGMGLRNYIMDLKKPPSGRLGLQNIYVMLSRASSWDDFAILRPFEDKIFQTQLDPYLEKYNQEMIKRDESTRLKLGDGGL